MAILDRSKAARKAWKTRVRPTYKAKKSEQASKSALQESCKTNGWKLLLFEGITGSPRTGIVDGIMARPKASDADRVEVTLVQLKGGKSGLKPYEVSRLEEAVKKVELNWVLAAFHGETNALHFMSATSAHSKSH